MAGVKKIPRDWSELLALLRSREIEFLVVGAYALAAWGYERNTKDLDLWLRPDAATAGRLGEVLGEFGFPELAPSAEEWSRQKVMIQLGREPYRVDLLNFATGLDFETAWRSRCTGELAGIAVACLGKDDLVANKLASGRLHDFADAEAIAPERRAEVRAALKRKLMEPDDNA